VHDDVKQHGVGEGVVLLHNEGTGLPSYTGKVLKAKTDTWHHDLSPSLRQDRLESLLNGMRSLADAALAAALVHANLHHRRIVPLMERRLLIYEMTEDADPTALARSQLLRKRFPREYATMRARRVVNLRTMPTDNDDLWSFIMLLDAPPVSRLPLSFRFLVVC
jgi:hypothetical protein